MERGPRRQKLSDLHWVQGLDGTVPAAKEENDVWLFRDGPRGLKMGVCADASVFWDVIMPVAALCSVTKRRREPVVNDR